MKRILFIIPSLATGGTNSSLDSFYTQFKDKYHIAVFKSCRRHNVAARLFEGVGSGASASVKRRGVSEIVGSFKPGATRLIAKRGGRAVVEIYFF